MPHSEHVAVIGLGYVGLPVALAFAALDPTTVGFDIDPDRIAALEAGRDSTGELARLGLTHPGCQLTADPAGLRGCTMFIIAVPTPIDDQRRPDLSALRSAARLVGGVIEPGAVVIVESTVFPGATQEVVGPVITEVSGLSRDDFKLGYSPERINPGDTEHTLQRVTKVVAGEDADTLERVAAAYEAIVPAGLHRASSIEVAEAAKVIENTQRDLNIALMNEFAMIFHLMGIPTRDVLAAAQTKWNFLPFTPGLVGGHCIGVDPYYLTSRAEQFGHHPEVILAGRRLNDGMGAWIARRVIQAMAARGRGGLGAKVAVLGVTFKPDVSDVRNSKVPDLVAELQAYGVEVQLHDPLANAPEVHRVYGIELLDFETLSDSDAVVLAVPHDWYRVKGLDRLLAPLQGSGVFYDVKSVLAERTLQSLPDSIAYMSL